MTSAVNRERYTAIVVASSEIEQARRLLIVAAGRLVAAEVVPQRTLDHLHTACTEVVRAVAELDVVAKRIPI